VGRDQKNNESHLSSVLARSDSSTADPLSVGWETLPFPGSARNGKITAASVVGLTAGCARRSPGGEAARLRPTALLPTPAVRGPPALRGTFSLLFAQLSVDDVQPRMILADDLRCPFRDVSPTAPATRSPVKLSGVVVNSCRRPVFQGCPSAESFASTLARSR